MSLLSTDIPDEIPTDGLVILISEFDPNLMTVTVIASASNKLQTPVQQSPGIIRFYHGTHKFDAGRDMAGDGQHPVILFRPTQLLSISGRSGAPRCSCLHRW